MIYTGCIYAHILRAETSEHDGWMYIGQAEDINKRWSNHRINNYKGSRFIYNEFVKYGWDAFDHIILEDNVSVEDLDEREKYWIKHYHTFIGDPEYEAGFNLTSGGDGSRGPKLTMRGVVPKNIPQLTEAKHKKVKCLNSGTWGNVPFKEGQTWTSINECAAYFGKGRTTITARVSKTWTIMSGPVLVLASDDYSDANIQKAKTEERERQHIAGFELAKNRKSQYEIEYNILCVETGEIFGLVVDCLRKFNMARATLNGHLNHPEIHKTAKGYHFKRIPKTNTNG